jgi:hypothetical protein
LPTQVYPLPPTEGARIECLFDRTGVRRIAQVFDARKAATTGRAGQEIDTPFEHMFDPSATYRYRHCTGRAASGT